jgi:hypothetical protein
MLRRIRLDLTGSQFQRHLCGQDIGLVEQRELVGEVPNHGAAKDANLAGSAIPAAIVVPLFAKPTAVRAGIDGVRQAAVSSTS